MSNYEISKEDWDRLTPAQRREIFNLVKGLLSKQEAEEKAENKQVRKAVKDIQNQVK